MKRIHTAGETWYDSQREILTLIKTTALTTRELADLRGAQEPPTWQALNALEERGYVIRFGKLLNRFAWGALWHWTGKPFPALPASLHLSELQSRALALPNQVKRFAFTEEITNRLEGAPR